MPAERTMGVKASGFCSSLIQLCSDGSGVSWEAFANTWVWCSLWRDGRAIPDRTGKYLDGVGRRPPSDDPHGVTEGDVQLHSMDTSTPDRDGIFCSAVNQGQCGECLDTLSKMNLQDGVGGYFWMMFWHRVTPGVVCRWAGGQAWHPRMLEYRYKVVLMLPHWSSARDLHLC